MEAQGTIYEFFIDRASSPLIVVRSVYGLRETELELIKRGYKPQSYTLLDEEDIDECDIEYTFD